MGLEDDPKKEKQKQKIKSDLLDTGADHARKGSTGAIVDALNQTPGKRQIDTMDEGGVRTYLQQAIDAIEATYIQAQQGDAADVDALELGLRMLAAHIETLRSEGRLPEEFQNLDLKKYELDDN